MTAWQVASLPFWVSGFAFVLTSISFALTSAKTPSENALRVGTAGIAMIMAIPFLFIAPWMWGMH